MSLDYVRLGHVAILHVISSLALFFYEKILSEANLKVANGERLCVSQLLAFSRFDALRQNLNNDIMLLDMTEFWQKRKDIEAVRVCHMESSMANCYSPGNQADDNVGTFQTWDYLEYPVSLWALLPNDTLVITRMSRMCI